MCQKKKKKGCGIPVYIPSVHTTQINKIWSKQLENPALNFKVNTPDMQNCTYSYKKNTNKKYAVI